MKALLGALILASAPGRAQNAPAAVAVQAPQAQLINLSLMEALVALDAQDLAGIFGFVPEASASVALADYLMHNRTALKKFVRKGEKDLKALGGVNAWDRLVFMHIMQMNNSPLPPGIERLPAKMEYKVSTLVLAPPLTLEEINGRRRGS